MKLSVLLIVVKYNSAYSTCPVRSADKTQLRTWLYPKTWGNWSGLCKYVANCDMIISAKMIKAQSAVKQDVTFKWWWKQLLCSLKEFVSGIKPCLQDMLVIYFSEIWYYKFAKCKKESGVSVHRKKLNRNPEVVFLTSHLTWANRIPVCFQQITFFLNKQTFQSVSKQFQETKTVLLSPSFSTKVKGSVSQPSSRLAGWTSRWP